ncbi:MAG: hypothetical protein ACK5AL_06360 [Planctomycetota bacterium]
MLLLRTCAAAAILAVLIPAQVEEVGGESDVRGAEIERRMKEGKGQRGEGEKENEENLTPEQRLARNVTSGAGAYCRFQASLVPAKLLPGQSGMLKVLATLQGNAVIPAPAPMEMVGLMQQGSVVLGPLSPLPAEPGRLAAAYLGRPVYDNYAIFDVPVTMAADAPLGSKHVAAVDMRFDLYDGNTAQPIGRFVDRVSLTIEVGAVPDPQVRGLAAPDAAPAAVAPAAAPPAAAPSVGAAGGAANLPVDGQVRTPEPATTAPAAAVEAPAGDGPVPSADGAEGVPMPLLLGGGVALAVLGILLLRRK